MYVKYTPLLPFYTTCHNILVIKFQNNRIYKQDWNNSNNNSNNFNFDINTMMKMKSIMDKMNSSRNDPRSNLLQSLKPYLNNNRKERLDQYMQFLNISKVLEAFNSEGGVNSK